MGEDIEELIRAVKTCGYEKVTSMLERNPELINYPRKNGHFDSALAQSVSTNRYKMIKLLLSYKMININFRWVGDSGKEQTAFHKSMWVNDPEVVKLFLAEEKLDLNSVCDYQTALYKATRKSYYLNSNESHDWKGRENNLEIIGLLLADSRVNVNIQDENGWTVLNYAMHNSSKEVVKLLASHEEVDPYIKDKISGKCLLELKQSDLIGDAGKEKLIIIRDRFGTPLDIIKQGDLEKIDELVDNDKSTRNHLLHLAAQFGTGETLKHVKEKFDLDFHRKDVNGHTPLILACLNDNVSTFETLLALYGPDELSDILETKFDEKGNITNHGDNIAQYCVKNGLDGILSTLFTCEHSYEKTSEAQRVCNKTDPENIDPQIAKHHFPWNPENVYEITGVTMKQVKKKYLCKIHKLYINKGLHTQENPESKNLIELMSMQGERLAKQKDELITLFTMVLPKYEAEMEIQKCLGTSLPLVNWKKATAEKYLSGGSVFLLMLLLIWRIVSLFLDIFTDCKVTDSFHENSFCAAPIEYKNSSESEENCCTNVTGWQRFSSSEWNGIMGVSIFHIILPFLVYSIVGTVTVKNDETYGISRVFTKLIPNTIFLPIATSCNLFWNQRKLEELKVETPMNNIKTSLISKYEGQIKEWTRKDLLNFLIEVGCEVSFQLFLQTGLLFSHSVVAIISLVGTVQEGELNILEKSSLTTNVPQAISIISSIYSLTRAYMASKRRQKENALDWKASVVLGFSLLLEIGARVGSICFFLHLINEEGKYEWYAGICIYYIHILIMVFFHIIFLSPSEMTNAESKAKFILRNMHAIVLNSLCSFFTYPGFDLEGTRGHDSTFVKQVVFYTIVGVENIAFSTIGFAHGYGKLMLPDGTSFHMSSTAQYWAQVLIVMAMAAAVILRIVYYRIHPAQPAIMPKLTADTIFTDARKEDKQKHDVENANTECNEAIKAE